MSLTSQVVPADLKDSVIIGDPVKFEAKKKKFLEGGKDALQIITDFDLTMTKFWVNGKRGMSCHGVIEHSTVLGAEFSNRTHQLFEKYYPIEINPEISKEEKTPMMIEWWSSAHDLMMEYGLKKHHIKEMFVGANIDVRDKCAELLEYSSNENLPLLIFSAGLANVLKEFLTMRGVYHPNIHVVSNLMDFDENGDLRAFEGELIHTMNKNATVLKKVAAGWAHDEKRKNILLLGDNLGDIHMSDGLECSEVISIGFLNDRINERLEVYKKTFDVVIINDGSMQFPLDFVMQICTHKSQ